MELNHRLYKVLRKNIHTRRLLNMYQIIRRIIGKGSYYSRSFFYIPEKKVLYLSVSKAGNTSIKASLFNLHADKTYRDIHRKVHSLNQAKNIDKIGEFPDYFKFTFVRSPFRRLVSCYENKLHTDQDKVGKTIRFLIYDSYLMGFLAKDRGFGNFARRVCMIPDRISDRHFVSQSMNAIGPDGKLLVDYVGKLENMEADYAPIREKYGFPPLPHYNRTRKARQNWMDYYDLDTARRVYKRYETDIRVFGYQKEYDKLVSYLKDHQTA